MNDLKLSQKQKHPVPSDGASGTPWLMALGVAVAGVVVIIMVARLGGQGRGPLESFSPPESSQAVRVAANRTMGQFETDMVTRTGKRWHLEASSLVTDEAGLHLEHPVMLLLDGSHAQIHLGALKAMVERANLTLHLEGAVTFTMQDDLQLRGEHLSLGSHGEMRGEGAFSLRTAHGASEGTGVRIDPAAGRIILSPGTPAEETIRWTGWGRDLGDLGETYREWARTALSEDRTVLQTAGPSS